MNNTQKRVCGLCGCGVALISIILFACSFSVVDVNYYGLVQNPTRRPLTPPVCGLLTLLLLLLWLCVQLKNKYTGKVDLGTVYDSGRYFTSLRRTFITFPAVRNNMEFSNVKGAPHQPLILCSCCTSLLGSYHATFARPPPPPRTMVPWLLPSKRAPASPQIRIKALVASR